MIRQRGRLNSFPARHARLDYLIVNRVKTKDENDTFSGKIRIGDRRCRRHRGGRGAQAAVGGALGRIAEPEDIADVITFLASYAARYMCGALVEVNGGKPVG